jgi:prophage antirepressor-like protein
MIDGEPWFVLADLCKIIGIANPSMVADRLEPCDISSTEVTSIDASGRSRKTQTMTIVSESGMYDVIMGSRSKQAQPFRRWVTAEVLPSIRKTGSYSIGQEEPAKPENVIDANIAWMQRATDSLRDLVADQRAQGYELVMVRETLTTTVKRMDTVEGTVSDVADRVANVEAITPLLDSENLLALRDVAHACGTGQNRMANLLVDNGILFRDHVSGLRAYQPWIESKWAISRYEERQNRSGWSWVTYFTPAGMTRLRRLGIVPPTAQKSAP